MLQPLIPPSRVHHPYIHLCATLTFNLLFSFPHSDHIFPLKYWREHFRDNLSSMFYYIFFRAGRARSQSRSRSGAVLACVEAELTIVCPLRMYSHRHAASSQVIPHPVQLQAPLRSFGLPLAVPAYRV